MPKKLTKEECVRKIVEIHGERYSYLDFNEYKNNKQYIQIKCKKCGTITKLKINDHITHRRGCKHCYPLGNKPVKFRTTESFKEEATLIHNGKYDYSNTIFTKTGDTIKYVCPIHGEIEQIAKDHLSGRGCKYCAGVAPQTTEQFIEQARKMHSGKYTYTKTKYGKNNQEEVIITCPIHGDFRQTPNRHLQGNGCPTCGNVKRITTESFKERGTRIFNGKYDYTKTIVSGGNKSYVTITCPIHGDFQQKINHHLLGHGCFDCLPNKKKTTERFILEAQEVHGDYYDYSKFKYTGSKIPGVIICPIHGEFEQKPTEHLSGSGCQKCKSSHLETEVRILLQENNIEFKEQYNRQWLGLQRLDFYLPKYNIAIECQGIQHFQEVKHFGGEKTFKETQERDKRKLEKCNENGVKILYYSNLDIDYPYKVYTNTQELMKEIKGE